MWLCVTSPPPASDDALESVFLSSYPPSTALLFLPQSPKTSSMVGAHDYLVFLLWPLLLPLSVPYMPVMVPRALYALSHFILTTVS